GDDALAVEPHAVAGSHDHRQPREYDQRRDAVERAEPVTEQRDGDSGKRGHEGEDIDKRARQRIEGWRSISGARTRRWRRQPLASATSSSRPRCAPISVAASRSAGESRPAAALSLMAATTRSRIS